jgi:poly-beta-1,6-N-acetyl-D-glucosamine synthase
MNEQPYVLVTSAFNEEKYLERTILSVLGQTVPPLRWVIVSDGSTDGTDSLICRYRRAHRFITYMRIDHDPNEPQPKFGFVARRKVNAISKALALLEAVPYVYIANIDGDISFGNTTFETLIVRLSDLPQVGVAGGYIYNNIDGRLRPYFTNPRGCGGPLQLFRRKCFEDIGGYLPYGHEDTIAGIMLRMRRWESRSFPDLIIEHHKIANCSGWRRCRSKYLLGSYDYLHCDTPLWEILRCMRELWDTPYVIGSFFRLAGYFKAVVMEDKVLPPEVQKFVQREQYQKLARTVLGNLKVSPRAK